mmetsp:Transcript_5465/g.19287  ORF Transcript_5465/g.19287 Transcript_5465/m.19287 type:complete len:122 (+) Transcript_5465:630-995(+)
MLPATSPPDVSSHKYGYDENLPTEQRKEIQNKLRSSLMKEGGDVRRFLGYFEDILKDNGSGFFVGDSVTIADCAMLPQLRQLKSGRLAGIPVTIVDEYPHLTNFCNKMMSLPAISQHYGSK